MTSETTEPLDPRAVLVGNEVRAWLGRRDVSQSQMAARLGLARSAASRRMRGERPFSITELMEIADWLDISLSELLGPDLAQARKIPRGDLVTTGAEKLPRLDSNQQPFD